jgi:hypothetical protein
MWSLSFTSLSRLLTGSSCYSALLFSLTHRVLFFISSSILTYSQGPLSLSTSLTHRVLLLISSVIIIGSSLSLSFRNEIIYLSITADAQSWCSRLAMESKLGALIRPCGDGVVLNVEPLIYFTFSLTHRVLLFIQLFYYLRVLTLTLNTR